MPQFPRGSALFVRRTAHPSMKQIRDIQFSSPEADRKVMLVVSFCVMFLLWILCVAILAFIGLAAQSSKTFVWDTKIYVIVALLTLLILLIIPIQLVRYFRQIRASR